RLVLDAGSVQIWLDDRLVSSESVTNPATAGLVVQASKGARVLSIDAATPPAAPAAAPEGFVHLPLRHYSHARNAQALPAEQRMDLKSADGRAVPIWATPSAAGPGADIDLGESLFRYRVTKDAGPDAGYVGSLQAYPDPFQIDPAMLTFRA